LAGISKGGKEMLATVLIVVVVLMLFGSLPTWNHSRSWGYGPSGGLGLVLTIVVILLLLGRL
jgi:hypothetical protein